MTAPGWIRGSPSTERVAPPAYPRRWLAPASLVRHPSREYLLGRGPLAAALGVGHQISEVWFDAQSPDLFWPDDRQWCVATEIDVDSTLVAGSTALIDDLIHAPQLETCRVSPGDSLRSDADHLNRSRRR